MSVPDKVREEVRGRLWELADSVDWAHLSSTDKTRHYEDWTHSPTIGGVLERFLDRGRIRVYLKDSLLKGYTRNRQADERRPLRALGISNPLIVLESYVKPHGRRLGDGKVVCWGRAGDWRAIITAVFERAYVSPGACAFAAVLFDAAGRWDEPEVHSMIEAAAERLGIGRVVWLGS